MKRLELQQIARTLGGIPIWTTFEGSVAHQAGLRYGDIILCVNGRPTPTVQDYFAAKELDSERITLTYFRNGRTTTLTLALRPSSVRIDSVLSNFVRSRAHALVGAIAKRSAN